MARVRQLLIGLASGSVLYSGMAPALGLGEITLHSALSQPLDAEIELLEQKSESDMRMHELEVLGEKLEQDFQLTKARVQLDMAELKTKHQSNFEAAAALRKQISQDVLERFEARLLRGVAIGRLQKNTCTACNMSITATALADLHLVPADEVASCPECQAILIR